MSAFFTTTLTLIDQANSADPNCDIDDAGRQCPKESLYAERMSARLKELYPDASEALQIAARAQHIERWKSPRSDYPEGRTGYKQWRANLGLFHAQRVGEIMATAGYPSEIIDRVKYLVQKRGLKRDNETQALEDTICIVFLKHYLNDFATKHNQDKLIDIIQKTWQKMSEHGHRAALALNYDTQVFMVLKKALNL